VAAGSGGRVTRFQYTIGRHELTGEQVDLQIEALTEPTLAHVNMLYVAREGQTLTWISVDGDIGISHDLRYVDSRTVPR
jgi:hypothetical protein